MDTEATQTTCTEQELLNLPLPPGGYSSVSASSSQSAGPCLHLGFIATDSMRPSGRCVLRYQKN